MFTACCIEQQESHRGFSITSLITYFVGDVPKHNQQKPQLCPLRNWHLNHFLFCHAQARGWQLTCGVHAI